MTRLIDWISANDPDDEGGHPSISGDHPSDLGVHSHSPTVAALSVPMSLTSCLGTCQVGIDTVSLCWRVHLNDGALRWLRSDDPITNTDGPLRFRRSKGMLLSNPVNGLTYGVTLGRANGAGASTVWVEGRAAVTPGELSNIAGVVARAHEALKVLDDAGFQPFGPDEVLTDIVNEFPAPLIRRLDVAADLRLSPEIGHRVIDSLATLELGSVHERGRIHRQLIDGRTYATGVDVRTQAGIGHRVYCKATEQAFRARRQPGPPSPWVRMEKQARWRGYGKGGRPLAADILRPHALANLWAAPWQSVLDGAADPAHVLQLLMSAAKRHEIPLAKAQRLAGWLVMMTEGCDGGSSSTRSRNIAELRSFGLPEPSASSCDPAVRSLMLEVLGAWRNMEVPPEIRDLES